MRSLGQQPLFIVGIPTNGKHSTLFTQSLMGIQWPTNFSMQMLTVPGYEVGHARNILIHQALEQGAKYILFIDEDVIAPANAARRLLYLLETHPEWTVAGALYCTKTYPPEPLLFKQWGEGPYWGFKQGDLVQVRGTGCGYHMFRLADLKAMKEPQEYQIRAPGTGAPLVVREYFKTRRDYEPGPNGVTTYTGHTEDSFFYDMAERANLQVWIDTAINCGHYDMGNDVMYVLPSDNNVVTKPEPWLRSPRVCNLGAGFSMNPYEVNVDLADRPGLHLRCDIRMLPPDWTEQFDEVKASHVLEHFTYESVPAILAEWVRLVKPGGSLYLEVPDMQWAAEEILRGAWDVTLQGAIWGDQGHPYWMQEPYGGESPDGTRFLPHSFENNSHKSGYTAKSLGRLMQAAGLVDIVGERGHRQISIRGYKPGGEHGGTSSGGPGRLAGAPGSEAGCAPADGGSTEEERRGGVQVGAGGVCGEPAGQEPAAPAVPGGEPDAPAGQAGDPGGREDNPVS